MERCLDWSGDNFAVVYNRQDTDWDLSWTKRRGIGLWCGGFAVADSDLGVLLGADCLFWRGVYPGVCEAVWVADQAQGRRRAKEVEREYNTDQTDLTDLH